MRPPPFSGFRSFMRVPAALSRDPDVTIFGVPFDLGTTNRPGARFGPEAVRSASLFLTSAGGGHPEFRVAPTSDLRIVDMGDLAIANGYMERSVEIIEEQVDRIRTHGVAVGGDHTITLPILRSLKRRHAQPVSLIHFDAHPDTWKDNYGVPIGHGTPFHYAAEEDLIDPRTSIQVGVRAPVDTTTLDYTETLGFSALTAEEVHTSTPGDTAKRITDVVGSNNPVYLTFDVDALDPSCAPGTGTPVVGGLLTWQALSVLKRLKGLNWVGMDLVEVAPAYDSAQITALAGATIIWTYLSLIAHASGTP